MKKGFTPRQLTLLGLLTAILIVMSCTPLGYLRIGALNVTLNMIPVAVAALVLGPTGGAIASAVFGLTSFASALTGGSAMGTFMVGISPVLAFIQSFVPRFLMGFLVGLVCRAVRKFTGTGVVSAIAGFLAAFLNTVLYMSSLVLLFGDTEYIQSLIGGRNIVVFICAFVGVNAVFEMLASTVITCVLGKTLSRAKLIGG